MSCSLLLSTPVIRVLTRQFRAGVRFLLDGAAHPASRVCLVVDLRPLNLLVRALCSFAVLAVVCLLGMFVASSNSKGKDGKLSASSSSSSARHSREKDAKDASRSPLLAQQDFREVKPSRGRQPEVKCDFLSLCSLTCFVGCLRCKCTCSMETTPTESSLASPSPSMSLIIVFIRFRVGRVRLALSS